MLSEKHNRDGVGAHRIDDLAHLSRRALLIGVDRPEVELLQAEVAGEVAEGALTGHKPAVLLGDRRQSRPDRCDGRLIRLVGLGIGL